MLPGFFANSGEPDKLMFAVRDISRNDEPHRLRSAIVGRGISCFAGITFVIAMQ